MRYNDLQDKCKECEHMKPWSLDMSGNHSCMCKEHELDYFNKRADLCAKYSKLSEKVLRTKDSKYEDAWVLLEQCLIKGMDVPKEILQTLYELVEMYYKE